MIIMRTSFAIACLALVASCTQNASGQKAHPLRTTLDSVGYCYGAEIGNSMRIAGLDSLSPETIAAGISDGMDSTPRISAEASERILNAYKIELQRRMIAAKQAEAEQNLRTGEAWLLENGKRKEVKTTSTGLQYEELKAGTGARPTANDRVRMHYKGSLIDGTVFDGTEGGEPAEYALTNLIPGLTEALQLMPIGSKWKVYIPAGLAYGSSTGPGGNLPPQSTLIFELELLDILPAPPGQ